MQPSMCAAVVTGACVSVALWASGAGGADRFEAPEAINAQADGSFHYVWKFYKGPGSAVLAGAEWTGTANVNGGLHGDCFCIPQTCTLVEDDSITFTVDGQLLDPEQPGSVLNRIGFCDVPGHEAATAILPFGTTGVGDSPGGLALRLWNGPNPFSARTTFHYVLPEPGRVTLRVHDLSGRTVATIVDEVESAGRHSAGWNARGAPASDLKAGVYFGRLLFRGQFRSTTLVIVP